MWLPGLSALFTYGIGVDTNPFGKIMLTASLLTRQVPGEASVCYSPRAPVFISGKVVPECPALWPGLRVRV